VLVEAQDPVYATVCAELAVGTKASHWMWFIFPQVDGVGQEHDRPPLRYRVA
jgi:uncharacterized protein (DUF1810 family)